MGDNNDELDDKTKDDKIKNIIAKLCKEQQDLNAKDIIEELKEIYKGDYRHKYSQITKVILEKSDSKEEGFAILAQNLRIIEESIQKFGANNELNKTQYKLEKLLDHINLEILRLGDSSKNFDKLDKKSGELQGKFNKLQNESKEIKDTLSKQQTQYITILGIFASIVLAFVGGFTFSTSALSNIDKVSIYRLVFVLSFIALFFGNILFALFGFLSKLNICVMDESKKWFQQPILYFNIIMVLIMVFDWILYFLLKYCF